MHIFHLPDLNNNLDNLGRDFLLFDILRNIQKTRTVLIFTMQKNSNKTRAVSVLNSFKNSLWKFSFLQQY